jgi:hypothetical protein
MSIQFDLKTECDRFSLCEAVRKLHVHGFTGR